MNTILIQEILTYFIVGGAITYALYQLVKIFIPTKNKNAGCTGCSGSCSINHAEKN
jgi:hypothetical protein